MDVTTVSKYTINEKKKKEYYYQNEEKKKIHNNEMKIDFYDKKLSPE